MSKRPTYNELLDEINHLEETLNEALHFVNAFIEPEWKEWVGRNMPNAFETHKRGMTAIARVIDMDKYREAAE
jgi:hypothetical protein